MTRATGFIQQTCKLTLGQALEISRVHTSVIRLALQNTALHMRAHTHTHTDTHTHTLPQPLISAAAVTTAAAAPTTTPTATSYINTDITNGLFNDDDWQKELYGIEVQDLDDTWRAVSLFRHKTNTEHVCLWFGGNEYEGIDPLHPYAYCSHTETLEDEEGYDIHWGVIGVENDTSDDEEEDWIFFSILIKKKHLF